MVATVNASTSAGVVITPDNSGVLALQSSSTTALTIDASQNSTFVGTASATKLIPTGSSATGNGLYLPAANSLGLSTNGTNAVTIDSSQNTTFVGNLNTATGKKYQVNSKTVNALAWVNLNGSGVVQQSFNISSVTVNATGDYTLNFTTALSDTGYVVSGTSSDTATYGRLICVSESTAPTTSLVRVVSFSRAAGTLAAGAYMSFVIFGN